MPYRKLDERVTALEKEHAEFKRKILELEQNRDRVAHALGIAGGKLQKRRGGVLTKELQELFNELGGILRSIEKPKE